MSHIVDTSIFVRQADQTSSPRPVALGAIIKLRGQGKALHTFGQNLIEFWAVATRPAAVNGLGLSIADADAERQRLELLFPLLPDPPDLYAWWVRIVN